MATLAAVCIRCGSKDHTTREHDERKVATKDVAKPKPKTPKAAPAADEGKKVGRFTITKVQHKTCWTAVGRNPGIPDVIDKPVRERFFHDPAAQCWDKRGICECAQCEKKRNRARLERSRRTPHLPQFGAGA